MSLVNKRFGNLRVDGYRGTFSSVSGKKHNVYACRCCLCGNTYIAFGKSLEDGNTVDCGCSNTPPDAIIDDKLEAKRNAARERRRKRQERKNGIAN